MTTMAIGGEAEESYLDEQRKLEELQREFRRWLQTKENIVRLADRRDQLLALLDAKYGYRSDDVDRGILDDVVPLADPLLHSARG